ncbi:AAA family ATPase [Saccharolobus shibatae]|uniref:Putative P-loop NTPase n=1 Tax=Saccharolobus shibatae TaxID=2286 RepID=A0A8F5BTJ1_9CREN|nr:ATP-binding protein [Saccharolobus shibatae]QXJ31218.1 putative P-loop NTPase [Saccharolobus shibatae]QXJ34233.1 putative P-loop NTPase [Saccharolobus shibatae]
MWFVYGKPTNNPFGREKEIESLIRLYKLGQPVGLIGPRRIGKTSLLLASLEQSSIPFSLISAEEFIRGEKGFDFAEFLSAYITTVTATIYSKAGYKVILEKGKSYLKQLRDLLGQIKVTFNVPELYSVIELTLDKAEKRKNLKNEFREAMDLPQILAEKFGLEKIVIGIDEFQYLRLAKQSIPGIYHVMRSKWQFHKNVTYVISGSLIGMMMELLNSREQPFYQFFYLMKVNPFDRKTSIDFLRKGFELNGLKISEGEIELIVNQVDGFPAWLNLVGIKIITERRSVREIIDSLARDVNLVTALENDLKKLSSTARAVLKSLAKLGGAGRPKDLGMDLLSVNRGLKQLINYGFVDKEERGIYRIIDPMLTKYLMS